ncbi:MAG: hypothetical protein U0R19_20645 [Bryobacteraceae bacterium]
MTCQEFATIRRDYARQQWLSDSLRQEAKQHLAECAACRGHLDTERALTTALAELSRQRDSAGPPPSVESALMAAFAERHQSRRNALWRKAAWVIPIAAGLLLFAILRTREPETRLVRHEVPRPTVVEQVPDEPAPVPQVQPKVRRAATAPRNSSTRNRIRPSAVRQTPRIGEPVVIVRMELPPRNFAN